MHGIKDDDPFKSSKANGITFNVLFRMRMRMRMRMTLSSLICLNMAVGVLESQVPGGIRTPDGVGSLLVGFEEKVYRGEANKILLSGALKGARNNLSFEIFDPPRHGNLTVNPKTGVAHYQPNNEKGVIEDRFRFRVRDDQGNFSAAVEVRLKIAERAARLELPTVLDFGKVVMKGARTRELIIENQGDAAFKDRVYLPAGFQVDGGDELELNIPAESMKSLMVSFIGKNDPEKGRALFELQEGNPKGRVVLSFEVNPPFRVQERLTLVFDDKSYTRNAELRIENPFEDKIKVRLMLPERLTSDDLEHEIAGSSTKSVSLSIDADDAAGFAGSVSIIEKRFAKDVEVFAEQCPARVVVVGMRQGDGLQFKGILDDKLKGLPDGFKRDIELRNEGGRPANVSVSVNPPFYLVGGSGPRQLRPGDSFILPVQLRPEKVGPVAEVLRVDYAGNPLVINLQGEVFLPPGVNVSQEAPPPKWREKKASNDPGWGGLSLRDLMQGQSQSRRRIHSAVPPVGKIRIVEQRSDSLVISWQVPAGENEGYVFEALVTLKDERTGFPVPSWVEINPEYLTITRSDAEVRAEIEGIAPGGEFEFRIFTVNEQGDSSLPARFRLAVKSKEGSFTWFRIWMLPLFCLVLTLLFSLLRRIRHERQLYG